MECRYNAVQYNMVLLTSLRWLRQDINQNLWPQKTIHASPWRASYGVSFVRILEKNDRVITVPCCSCYSPANAMSSFGSVLQQKQHMSRIKRAIRMVVPNTQPTITQNLKGWFDRFIIFCNMVCGALFLQRVLYTVHCIAGTLGCVFIDNETHKSGVTKCTTGEAWSAFSWHHSSVFHCQWTHNL